MPLYPGGYSEFETHTPRQVLVTEQGAIITPADTILDSSTAIDGANTNTYDIRAGWIMAYNSTTGKWAPCKRTAASGDTESSSTADDQTDITVLNAGAFKAGDVITAGPHTGLTIVSVDYTTNKILVDSAVNVFDGDAVFATNPAYQTAYGILLDFVRLRNSKNTADADRGGRILIAGLVWDHILLGDKATIFAASGMKLGEILRSSEDAGFAT